MTERYVFDPSIYHFTDTQTGKTYCEYNLDKVVDMLNKYEEGKRNLNEINGILNATADNLIAENTHLMELHKFDEETIKQLEHFKQETFNAIDKRINTLEANSKQCHRCGSHEKGIEFTLQAELLQRLRKALEDI